MRQYATRRPPRPPGRQAGRWTILDMSYYCIDLAPPSGLAPDPAARRVPIRVPHCPDRRRPLHTKAGAAMLTAQSASSRPDRVRHDRKRLPADRLAVRKARRSRDPLFASPGGAWRREDRAGPRRGDPAGLFCAPAPPAAPFGRKIWENEGFLNRSRSK